MMNEVNKTFVYDPPACPPLEVDEEISKIAPAWRVCDVLGAFLYNEFLNWPLPGFGCWITATKNAFAFVCLSTAELVKADIKLFQFDIPSQNAALAEITEKARVFYIAQVSSIFIPFGVLPLGVPCQEAEGERKEAAPHTISSTRLAKDTTTAVGNAVTLYTRVQLVKHEETSPWKLMNEKLLNHMNT